MGPLSPEVAPIILELGQLVEQGYSQVAADSLAEQYLSHPDHLIQYRLLSDVSVGTLHSTLNLSLRYLISLMSLDDMDSSSGVFTDRCGIV